MKYLIFLILIFSFNVALAAKPKETREKKIIEIGQRVLSSTKSKKDKVSKHMKEKMQSGFAEVKRK